MALQSFISFRNQNVLWISVKVEPIYKAPVFLIYKPMFLISEPSQTSVVLQPLNVSNSFNVLLAARFFLCTLEMFIAQKNVIPCSFKARGRRLSQICS